MSKQPGVAFILLMALHCNAFSNLLSRTPPLQDSLPIWRSLMCQIQIDVNSERRQLILIVPYRNLTDIIDTFINCIQTPLLIIRNKERFPKLYPVNTGSERALILVPDAKITRLKGLLKILPKNPDIQVWVVFTTKVRIRRIASVFQVMWDAGYVNSVLLTHRYERVLFYRYYPFSDSSCNRTGPPVIVSRWTPGAALSKSIFDDYRITKFHGCALRCGTFDHPPAVIIKDGESKLKAGGIVGEIIRMLSHILTFQCNVSTTSDGWGYSYPNGTSYGLQGDVINGIVDLAFADFLQSLYRWQTTDMIEAYREDCLAIVVPSGLGETQFVWSVLTNEFSFEMWSFLALAIVGCIVLTGFISRISQAELFWSFSSSTVFVFMTFFGVPVTVRPESSAARIFFSMWFVFSMVVGIAYLAAFSSLVTVPWKPKNINTLKELIERNLTVYTYPTLLVFLSDDEDHTLVSRRVLTTKAPLASLMKSLPDRRDHAVLFPKIRINFELAEMNPSVATKFHVFKDFYVSRTMVSPILTKRGSPLSRTLNEAVERVIESGLVDHWLKEIPQSRRQELGSTRSFSLRNVLSAFVLYAVGITASTVVFIFERFLSKNNNLFAKSTKVK